MLDHTKLCLNKQTNKTKLTKLKTKQTPWASYELTKQQLRCLPKTGVTDFLELAPEQHQQRQKSTAIEGRDFQPEMFNFEKTKTKNWFIHRIV